jgi:hypothetical protein
VQRARTFRLRPADVTREAPVAGPGLDNDERIGAPEVTPVAVERSRNARTEQRADLGTRDEVAAGAPRAVTHREEPGARLVEREIDEAIERDRTLAPDQARDRFGGCAG